MYACMYLPTHGPSHIRTYIHTYMHTYLHTYIHTAGDDEEAAVIAAAMSVVGELALISPEDVRPYVDSLMPR